MTITSSTNSINELPPKFKKQYLFLSVVRILTGAKVEGNYEGKKDLVNLEWNGENELLHIDDFMLAKKVADIVWKEEIEGNVKAVSLYTVPEILRLTQLAYSKIEKFTDEKYAGKRGVLFIKDKSGCGYWRMVVPLKYMDTENFYHYCTETDVPYDYLMSYDTIVVQRLYNWHEFHLLKKLKEAGKKIIYDIDDDIFNIPTWNPAYSAYGKEQRLCAKAIMGLVDVVVTTNEQLKKSLGFEDKTVIIPNSIDIDDGYFKLSGVDAVDLKLLEPKDEFKRIYWQGSASHDGDWHVTANAIDRILQKRDDVRLLIVGFLPTILRRFLEDKDKPWWDKKVEFQNFTDVDTYIAVSKILRADVALAPLANNEFNTNKSSIKFKEATAMAIPMIASDMLPYIDAIKDGVNGYLAKNEYEWHDKIIDLLDNPSKRLEFIKEARKTVDERFDIKKNVKLWEEIL